ncbi:MAG: T9SS type A sorting domain-containing protein [Candidatus Krumholzibacteriota bacterium]|nr:T9SS type A sorting domain-containing protein [Candidatus Krumholzibacteriota bacterium]
MILLRSHLVLPLLIAAPCLAFLAAGAQSQCIIANPSFEVGGSGGEVFGGWNQFGVVGSSATIVHGSAAAKVVGPDLGGWDVSGFWQRFDSAPGEQWAASVMGWHTSVNPLTGDSKAILNIEWRDAGEGLISYESHTVADAATPFDEIQEFTVTSGPAPTGTVTVRLVLAVLQSPLDPPPDVYYDLADFNNAGSPTIDDIQWNDFPGGNTLDFSSRTWRIKGPGYYGPGPNLFCDDPSCTWVDLDGRLHMTITKSGNSWYSTEIVLEEALGYGDYIFTTAGRLDQLDPSAVLGIFLWQYGPCWDNSYLWWNPYNEIDVEFSRWGDPGSWIGQFVAQPYDWPGNISRFDASFSEEELTSHAFNWMSDKVEFRSWRGGPLDEEPANMIHEWTYTGPHISRPEQPRVHINLWRCCGEPPADQEIIFDRFTFVPPGATVDSDIPGPSAHLAAAVPNPFNPATKIGYTLDREGFAEITVYNITGQYICTLVKGVTPAGNHEIRWNGKNESGSSVASGVYLYQLRTDTIVETRKMVLLR